MFGAIARSARGFGSSPASLPAVAAVVVSTRALLGRARCSAALASLLFRRSLLVCSACGPSTSGGRLLLKTAVFANPPRATTGVGNGAVYPASAVAVDHRRSLFGWLNTVFNKVDEDRIQEVGPDMAAAEWVLRCGGGVRWKGHPSVTRDYNLLPSVGSQARIEMIDATESCVMSHGFPYLRGLEEVKEMKLVRCPYLDDDAFAYLVNLEKLDTLKVISCGNVTSAGLEHIKRLKQLKRLVLFDLPEVNRKEALKDLRDALPDTRVEFQSTSRTKVESKR